MKKANGITLVALVITLLILLILTAVTIKIFINRELISMTVNAGKQWSQ